MEPIIKAENLNFIYNKGKDNEFQALININLLIYPEEFVIVFGPSGCGKSTLLNVIAGLETPDNGSLVVAGQDITKMSKNDFAGYHRRRIGMIYQSYNLITSLTVLDNVALPQLFINIYKRKREKLAIALLERFDIKIHAKKVPTELSGGQQQRIGIARAIINNPDIILADEPVGNLDSVSAKHVLDILEELNEKEKKTVILVTHNPENLVYGDRIIYMKDGMITREVVNRDKHKDKKLVREMAPKTVTAELLDLMRVYHGLTPEQINILIMPYKSKIFAHHFITTRSMEETKVFEDIVQRRLLGTISQAELQDVLNRPSDEGGVGYDRRTAEKIVRRINRVIRLAFFVYQKSRQRIDKKGLHIKITIEEKVGKVLDYLLKTCYLEHMQQLNEMQLSRIRQALRERLTGEIQKTDFYKALDSPIKVGGVGLNSKTAKAMSEELELILILGFGVVPMVRTGGVRPSAQKESPADKLTVGSGLSGHTELTPEKLIIKREVSEEQTDVPAINQAEVLTASKKLKEAVTTEKIVNEDLSAGEANLPPVPLPAESSKAGFDKEKATGSRDSTNISQSTPSQPTESIEKEKVDTLKPTEEIKTAPTWQDAMFALQEREEKMKHKK